MKQSLTLIAVTATIILQGCGGADSNESASTLSNASPVKPDVVETTPLTQTIIPEHGPNDWFRIPSGSQLLKKEEHVFDGYPQLNFEYSYPPSFSKSKIRRFFEEDLKKHGFQKLTWISNPYEFGWKKSRHPHITLYTYDDVFEVVLSDGNHLDDYRFGEELPGFTYKAPLTHSNLKVGEIYQIESELTVVAGTEAGPSKGLTSIYHSDGVGLHIFEIIQKSTTCRHCSSSDPWYRINLLTLDEFEDLQVVTVWVNSIQWISDVPTIYSE